jgi:hypothetical protein
LFASFALGYEVGMDTGFLFSLATLVVLAAVFFIAIWRNQSRIAKEHRERAERQSLRADHRPPPSPDGKFTAFDLWPQAKYRVVAAFVDYDHVTHEVGERWTFLRKAFLPYEDGLSLFVEENGREIHIRMQCRDDAQGQIVHAFSDYVVEE